MVELSLISPVLITNFFAKLVMVQNIKRIVKALARADMKFTILAISVSSLVNIAKNAPSIWNNGAPGGWPTSNFTDVDMYSPQSHALTVGSSVRE